MSETSNVIGELEAFVEKTIKKLTVEITNNLFDATPELTGFAESNWIPRIGKPVLKVSGTKLTVSRSAQEAGLAAVNLFYQYPQSVYISNPTDYIHLLNAGSSAKAPAFFVQTSIAKGIKSVV